MIPAFDQLPELGTKGDRHAWDVWGRDDTLGSINRLTPERVLAAVANVRQGKVINLDLRLDTPQPGLRPPYQYHLIANRGSRDDYVDGFYLQGSTQIDGLGHISYPGEGYWGGRDDATVDKGEIGIDHWARHGLVGRGVLIDAVRFASQVGVSNYGPDERIAIDGPMIEAIAAAESVDLNGTDFLVLHTGWLRNSLLATTDEGRQEIVQKLGERSLYCPGLDGKQATAAWLWDHGIVGVLADNFALEALPVSRDDGFQHRRLIPLMGMVVGELIDVTELADDSTSDGQYDFLLSLKAIHVPGAVGSPANGCAIK